MTDFLQNLRRAPFLFVLFVVISVQLYLTTYGTWNLFEHEIYGGAYDALADSLIQGGTEIPISEIYMEGIRSNGKLTMYFAPFPAFPRIIAHVLFPDRWGKWSRLSQLFGAAVALYSFLLLWTRIAGASLSARGRGLAFPLLALAFALGTPLIFLVSSSYIFHEAVTWGLAWSIFTLAASAALETQRSRYSSYYLFLFGVGAGLAILSRITFGIFFLPLAAFYTFDSMRSAGKSAGFRLALPCIVPLALCIVFYLWYNYDRFGSPFIFGTVRHVFPDEYTIEIVERTGTFNLKRIPTGLINFFGPPTHNFLSEPPFFQLAIPRVFVPELYPHRYQREAIGTLMLTGPWLIIGALAGASAIISKPRILPLLTSALLLGEILLVASVRHLSHRFIAECLPLLAYLFAHGCRNIFQTERNGLRRTMLIAIALAGAVSIAANIGSTLAWNAWDNWGAPVRWRKLLTEKYVTAEPPRRPLDSSSAAPP